MIHVYRLERHGQGIDVKTNLGWVFNVHENVVRCALGDQDTEYLLRTHCDELGFTITESEYEDCFKHKASCND